MNIAVDLGRKATKQTNKLWDVSAQVKINKKFESIIVKLFLPISFNICFGCSKEP